MSCDGFNKEWTQCLSRSNRNPSKCQDKEAELRKCAKTSSERFCIDETVSLMECTRNPSTARKEDFCAKQFIAMRECHRPSGPQLIVNSDGGYTVAESAKSLFNDNVKDLQTPPNRQTTGLAAVVKEVQESLGISPEVGLRF